MKRLFLLTALCSLLASACSDSDKDNDTNTSERGFAPSASSVAGRTLRIDDSFYDFTFSSASSGVVTVNSVGRTFGYSIDGTPSFVYEKTSDNSATFRATVPYYFNGQGVLDPGRGTHSYLLTLFFISPHEGFASGQAPLGGSDMEFTLL